MALPKRCIEISAHAHHRALSRFELSKAKSTHRIRKALRRGRWYASPDTPDEFLVLDRFEGMPFCVICAIEAGTVHVRTLYPLANPGQLAPYKRAGGPFTAQQVVDSYGLDR